MRISINKNFITGVVQWLDKLNNIKTVILLAVLFAIGETAFFYSKGYIIVYGDAESHLNIAKRVIDSLTPGFAQLGGIWLPLPHIFMIPFVYFNSLWRTGLAGAIVSGIAYIITSVFIYRTIFLLTKNKAASFAGFLAFALNPNIAYLQSTPMTELTLIMFFMLSSYYFIKYLYGDDEVISLIIAAIFGFCATLSRYDGWFLVCLEGLIMLIKYFPYRKVWSEMEGKVILFSTFALFGILLWFLWGFLILGDPFYFTHSQFSAKSQQQNWLARGELPAYKNILVSLMYYFVTSMSNVGVIVFFIALIGFIYFISDRKQRFHVLIALLLLAPFIFNVLTLYLGQSVIFIPSITPVGFEWRLFNVRYGALMVPVMAIFFGYVFKKANLSAKVLIVTLCLFQVVLFGVGYSKVMALADGIEGLSHAKVPDAEHWMTAHYDKGLVLMDDYARTMSIIRSNIPMENVIYIGNRPYWEESLATPERYATWVVMQKDDTVWKALHDKPEQQARLFKYFNKVYTSKEILIFKKIPPQDVGKPQPVVKSASPSATLAPSSEPTIIVAPTIADYHGHAK